MGLFSTSGTVAVLGVLIYFLKQHINGPVCEKSTRLDGKVVVVTGTTSGIGREIAAEMAKRGARVYLTSKTLKKGLDAANALVKSHPEINKDDVTIMKLDYAARHHMDGFIEEFKKKESKLDILVHNAGVMKYEVTETLQGHETMFGVNHLGPFYVTLKLLDELLAGAPSRVITVTSDNHRTASGYIDLADPMLLNYWSPQEAYSNSKLASMITNREIGRRLKSHGVSALTVSPGSVLTNITREAPILGIEPIRSLYETLIWPFHKDPYFGAQAPICLALDPDLKNKTLKHFSGFVEAEPRAAGINDIKHGEEVWNLSLKMLGISSNDVHHKLSVQRR